MKLALGLLAVVAFAQDPVETLDRARNQVLAHTRNLPEQVCVETIDRSYYSRKNAGDSASCERLLLDRKNGRDVLRLDKTDRLRVAVRFASGREIYSWTGPAPYDHGVEDILNGGPIGTGPFAAQLTGIFVNPAVRFRLLTEAANFIEYGFRVPVEASPYLVMGGGKWQATGYSGSVRVDRGSLAVERLEMNTGELPPDTGICEEDSVLEFHDPGRYLPTTSRVHMVMRDTTETERAITMSGCREAVESPSPALTGQPLEPRTRVKLTLDRALDSDTAAGGDEVSATVRLPLILAGAKVTGRIVHVVLDREPTQFEVTLAFDTIEREGMTSPFYARLVSPPSAKEVVLQKTKLTGHGRADWPHGTLIFHTRKPHFVIPASFQSTWETVEP
jgi:hypothetical protein